jgi:DNA transformation protein
MKVEEHIADVFRDLGPVEMRRMFSGCGLFRDGLMFGLVHDETLYLKADAGNAANFEDLGLPRFQYARAGKVVRLSYYRAPDSVWDDSAEAIRWARSAFEAALRGTASKAKSGKKRRTKG